MRKLRETTLSEEQLLAMLMHSQRRTARLCAIRATGGDKRYKLLAVIIRACSAESMWYELYSEAKSKKKS
jgi:hypothetical protein